MEDALLWNWKAPIINDFFVMVCYGLLKKMCARRCGDESGTLHHALLCDVGGVESAEPARRLLQLARAASESEKLRELILGGPLESLPQCVAADAQFEPFQALFEQYLVRALRISQGDPSVLFSSTLGNVLWGFLVLSLLLPAVRSYFQKRKP